MPWGMISIFVRIVCYFLYLISWKYWFSRGEPLILRFSLTSRFNNFHAFTPLYVPWHVWYDDNDKNQANSAPFDVWSLQGHHLGVFGLHFAPKSVRRWWGLYNGVSTAWFRDHSGAHGPFSNDFVWAAMLMWGGIFRPLVAFSLPLGSDWAPFCS